MTIMGICKVSLGSAMPDPSTPCGRANPETNLAVSGVARPQGGKPVAVFYPISNPHAVRLYSLIICLAIQGKRQQRES
jgi:hypothetical protein